MKNITSLFLLLAVLVACGKGGGGSSGGDGSLGIQEQVAEGSYRAVLRPYNNQLSGFLPSGFAEIKISGDEVEVKTLLEDDARAPHMQSIHAGTRCPTMGADANGDGIVDAVESQSMAGPVLIPLDADLNSDELGAGVYPMGRSFTYIEKASLVALEGDVKNRMNQNLNLGGRVVIIHGVAAHTKMPATVATVNGMTPQNSVPIACGVLQRVENR